MLRSPYISQAPSVTQIMCKVLLALMPAIAVYVWVYGAGILLTIALASVTALLAETCMLRWRSRPVRQHLMDGSALVTAWLLALALPPLAPWWLIVIGTMFAIVVSKQLYGGLGYNLFNPAMVGYAVLLISFPALMTHWPAPVMLADKPLDFWQQAQFIFTGQLPMHITLDAVTSATPLDYLKTQLMLEHSVEEIRRAELFGYWGGKQAEWVTCAYLLGGLYLLQQKIITWHLPFAFIAMLAAVAGIFHLVNPQAYADPMLHLLSGASMMAAFFIITDPVSGPTTPKGKLWFAAGIALMTYLIRVYGGYPDGVAFAVIFFNICVPLIDALTQPRVFGHAR